MKAFERLGLSFVPFQLLSERLLLEVLEARNSDEVRPFMFEDRPIPVEEHLRFVDSLRSREDAFYWAALEGDGLLGVIDLVEVDRRHGRAQLGIYSAPGSPGGTGSRLMEGLRFAAFELLGLNSIRALVLEGNERAVRFYERCGFSFEGRLREYVRRGDLYLDVLVYSLLRREAVKQEY